MTTTALTNDLREVVSLAAALKIDATNLEPDHCSPGHTVAFVKAAVAFLGKDWAKIKAELALCLGEGWSRADVGQLIREEARHFCINDGPTIMLQPERKC